MGRSWSSVLLMKSGLVRMVLMGLVVSFVWMVESWVVFGCMNRLFMLKWSVVGLVSLMCLGNVLLVLLRLILVFFGNGRK